MANKKIDIEDLVPAQVFGLVTLVQFGIVELTAYDGAINLGKEFNIVGQAVSLAFAAGIVSFGIIAVTNELELDDFKAWDDNDRSSLDDSYQWILVGTVIVTVGVEFIGQINSLITGNDIIGTAAFALCVAGVWVIVWAR